MISAAHKLTVTHTHCHTPLPSQGGLDLSSEFHNDLYTFNLDKRRWYAAELRPPPKSTKAAANSTDDAAAGSSSEAGASGSGQAGTSGGAGAQGAAQVSPAVQALLAAGKDKNSPIYRAAVKIQAQFRGYVVGGPPACTNSLYFGCWMV